MANYSIDELGQLFLNDGGCITTWGHDAQFTPWHEAARQFWTQLQTLNSENEALQIEVDSLQHKLRKRKDKTDLMQRTILELGEQLENSKARYIGVDWCSEDPARIDVIGQNGNTGEHYAYLTPDSKVVRLGWCVQLSEREVELLALLSKAGVIVDQELLAEMRETFRA